MMSCAFFFGMIVYVMCEYLQAGKQRICYTDGLISLRPCSAEEKIEGCEWSAAGRSGNGKCQAGYLQKVLRPVDDGERA